MARNKPTLKSGPASHYEAPNEIIREFGNGKGDGGLLSIRNLDDGQMVVELYQVTGPVIIHAGRFQVPNITPTVRGFLAQAAADARAAGLDADTQNALDTIARLGITESRNTETSDADILREVGVDEAADDLDEHLGGTI